MEHVRIRGVNARHRLRFLFNEDGNGGGNTERGHLPFRKIGNISTWRYRRSAGWWCAQTFDTLEHVVCMYI